MPQVEISVQIAAEAVVPCLVFSECLAKKNSHCKSDVYPVGRGGAPMPYCMYFHKGFALHGSDDIPGYRASHGCVRMFTRDAKWLNEEFVEISNDENNHRGTKVIVRPAHSIRSAS